ncbi:hypothetical protein HJC23_012371 [Cyclotella cryptica]|uniref:Sugar fermentation stimulation protein C-terminal domain-containing protein n=1 Tax=Cyclotella cryptica TaxID=29204 RepID=A0ABD3QCG9_9STRA|eukprot:CCRYP_006573-RA/>CCRYP_006573-RA protein AED:0.14 eAED:0.14 QI:0/-1/0/1/-1/1/1/0/434
MARTPGLLTLPSHRRRSARILNSRKSPTKHVDEQGIENYPESNSKVARSTRKRPVSSLSITQNKKVSSSTHDLNVAQTQHSTNTTPLLFSLGTLVRGTLTKRPSTQIKSPYVADVSIIPTTDHHEPTVVQAHAPALDVGGMCVPGSEVYMSTRPPGGKTSHAIELVRSDAPTTARERNENGVLVGAHPRLGEMIAREVLRRGFLRDALPLGGGLELGPVTDSTNSHIQKNMEETITDGKLSSGKADLDTESEKLRISLKEQITLGDSRVDFEITIQHPITNKSHRVIFEVKNVVCADYERGTEPIPSGPNHCVIVARPSEEDTPTPYQRTALFPWAKSRSQTFEGKKVCSSRALKHLRNLQSLADGGKDVTPVVLFVLNRCDCASIRACHEACPVFGEVLEEVTRNGDVKALGVRVRWTEEGGCYFDGVVPVRT